MVSPRVAGGSGAAIRTLRDALNTAEADAIVAALGRHAEERDLAASELGVSRGYLDARARALGLG
jgi:transcriptional regulator with PAS, ATPase and Fis domain